MNIRPVQAADRPQLDALLQHIEAFTPEDRGVALELIDAAIADAPGNDYEVLVAVLEQAPGAPLVGYICFGPTPMTRHAWDLYWIVSHPHWRETRAGSALLQAMVGVLAARGARVVRIETSSTEAYGAAQRFYARNGVVEAGRIPDFYSEGDALLVLYKVIEPAG